MTAGLTTAGPAAGATPFADSRCGSDRGYQAHRRRGETPCEACRKGRNAERRARERVKPKPRKPDTTPRRFWGKVTGDDFTTCWEWTAYRDQNGYGRFNIGGRAGSTHMAHRVAYELLIGPVPNGLELDHLCRNRACVNPWHLDPVTHLVNSRRGIAGQVNAERQRAITHCPEGHPYDGQNTTLRSSGARRCKTCSRQDHQRRYQQNPEKYREVARQYRVRRKERAA